MVEWFRNFESDLSSMNVDNYMNAKKMEKSLNSLIQKHRFEAPVLVTIQVLAQIVLWIVGLKSINHWTSLN